MDAQDLRSSFTGFFESKGHMVRPSASLVADDPTLMFTIAGMVPFKRYFTGEDVPPAKRITSVQKCVRLSGKANDLEEVGRTTRHCTFFEMLGNFSFGDYFKSEAIPWAWEFVIGTLGLDPDRIWVTIHESDDDAERIWLDDVGLDPDRLQRLDDDNWWMAGETGPCGPSSEIFFDRGPEHGASGGPAHGSEERYVEIWNLVFMQFDRAPSGDLRPLPFNCIDTGAGLERILTAVNGVDSIFDLDSFRTLIATAENATGHLYGADERSDVSLRILADHARSTTMLVNDGVFPSNEGPGYVLRRILRRAVRHAFLLGVERSIMTELVAATVADLAPAYPDLERNLAFITSVIGREEQSFSRTLAAGSEILESELEKLGPGDSLSGSVAFTLHDTYGFPLEVTAEVLAERGFGLDTDGFEAEMTAQRERARQAARSAVGVGADSRYRDIIEQFGETEFLRDERTAVGRVVGVGPLEGSDDSEIILDRTPFYAEAGGQVGDTGVIRGDFGEVSVIDTVYAAPGVIRHVVGPGSTLPDEGEEVEASIDAERRAAIRRNHTATHVLHWALREVLGDHVKQAGSLVAPDRLRFDFSHFESLSPEDLARIEDLANAEVLANSPVNHFETTMDEATDLGAIAFFGEKYGDVVRVLRAGPRSIELCGGTHVDSLGDIGHIRIVSESSIGSNVRRIEAITGTATVERLRTDEDMLATVARQLGVAVDELPEAVDRRLAEIKDLRRQLKDAERSAASSRAADLGSQAVDGVVVARVDGVSRDELRDLVVATRDQPGVRAVVIGGEPEGGGAGIVAAVTSDAGVEASALLAEAGALIGGGGRPAPDLMMVGGKDPGGVDEALERARAAAGLGA